MPIVRNLPDPAGTAAVVTAPAQQAEVGGQPSAFQAAGVVVSCGPTGGMDQKNVNMVGGNYITNHTIFLVIFDPHSWAIW